MPGPSRPRMPRNNKSGGEKLVYKIDSIIATIRNQRIMIQVKGAVPSGGWRAARLRLVRSPAEPHTVGVTFVAIAPPVGMPVIHGLLPVGANAIVPMRRGVVTVRAVSSANEMTTQILR